MPKHSDLPGLTLPAIDDRIATRDISNTTNEPTGELSELQIQHLMGNNLAPVGFGPAAAVKLTAIVTKSADLSKTSDSTRTADPDLVVAVEANKVYFFQMIGRVLSNSATPDFTYSYTGPAGSTVEFGTGFASSTLTTTSNNFLLTPGTTEYAKSVGWIETAGTAGNLTYLWAQLISNATATTLKKGSILMLWEVA